MVAEEESSLPSRSMLKSASPPRPYQVNWMVLWSPEHTGRYVKVATSGKLALLKNVLTQCILPESSMLLCTLSYCAR